jgi:hypothetical protein
MNYFRVALLLALALVSRTADAWVLDAQPVATDESTVLPLLYSLEDFRMADPFQHTVGWPISEGGRADTPNARAEETLGIDQQLAVLFQRGISLLKTNVSKVIAYASRYWHQAVAYCGDDSPNAGKVGLDIRATLDDLVGTMSNKSPAENQQSVRGGLAGLNLIEYLCASSWRNNNYAEQWNYLVENLRHKWTNGKQLPMVRLMATRSVQWAEKLLEDWKEDWKAVFRNTSGQFAQLNWTILFGGQTVDRAAGNAVLPPKAVAR